MARYLRVPLIDSIGTIAFEKKMKREATEIDASIVVSSDLNK